MELASYFQLLLSGITVGSIYGLTALGFTIIFNTTGIINFAQGEFVMLGGMLAVFALKGFKLGVLPSIFISVVVTTIIGAAIERITIRPVRGGAVLNLIIATIGVSIFIRGVIMFVFGKDTYGFPQFTGDIPLTFWGVAIMPQSLWVIAVTVLLLLWLFFFFKKTIFGKAMLACSHDRKASYLVGISVNKMVLASFAISALVGAIGGAILTPITLTSYDVGIMLGLKGFSACIIGGLGNPFGAAFGGIILGILESFGAGLISSAYKDAFAFFILLVLLFFRPTGLLGLSKIERV